MFDLIIVGGGAAGFYAAIHVAEQAPGLDIAILERGKTVLSKVKVSGGGRCNITHGEFSPKELTTNYPRGERELLGPFHKHAPMDVMDFFERRGVPLKVESDGRVFPKSDSSQSVIDCFLGEAERLGVRLLRNSGVTAIKKTRTGWDLTTMNKVYETKKVLLATGSNTKVWQQLKGLGHTIVPPLPSLFTFHIEDERLKGIQGISTRVEVVVPPKRLFAQREGLNLRSQVTEEPLLRAEGPVLVTHWGLSGPAILRLSAWGARLLAEHRYRFKIQINWCPDYSRGSMEAFLREIKDSEAKKTVLRSLVVELPRRLWIRLVTAAGIRAEDRWGDLSREKLQNLAKELTASSFEVAGKSPFKEEFVTAGGVALTEINFKTMESKLHPGLYFAGEIIDVDAITGGFNFQNAWTGAFLAAQHISATFPTP